MKNIELREVFRQFGYIPIMYYNPLTFKHSFDPSLVGSTNGMSLRQYRHSGIFSENLPAQTITQVHLPVMEYLGFNKVILSTHWYTFTDRSIGSPIIYRRTP